MSFIFSNLLAIGFAACMRAFVSVLFMYIICRNRSSWGWNFLFFPIIMLDIFQPLLLLQLLNSLQIHQYTFLSRIVEEIFIEMDILCIPLFSFVCAGVALCHGLLHLIFIILCPWYLHFDSWIIIVFIGWSGRRRNFVHCLRIFVSRRSCKLCIHVMFCSFEIVELFISPSFVNTNS